ncbi:hypothetical protein HA402_014024 [Bradysia odoriphaga]|nr:hypothetical protein HA402_014024 [Bradysia odoriphaga]
MSHLKVKVTERSCRERVNKLLKKHRKEETVIIRSSGATEDTLTEVKKLLITINEMALTQPQETHSSLYSKKICTESESIRDEALKCISSASDDDYIRRKYPRSSGFRGSTLNRGSRNNDELNSVTNVNGCFRDQNMSLAEEEEMLRQCALEMELDLPVLLL